MPRVTPRLSITAELEQKLVSGVIHRLYFEQVRIYHNSYEQAETSVPWLVTTNSSEQPPNYVFVAFQPQAKFCYQETKPMAFDAGPWSCISCWIYSIPFLRVGGELCCG